MNKHSCFKVQNYVQEENSIGYAVKSDPRRAHVVIKESNGDRQDEHIHDQHGENHEIPIEPEKKKKKNRKKKLSKNGKHEQVPRDQKRRVLRSNENQTDGVVSRAPIPLMILSFMI